MVIQCNTNLLECEVHEEGVEDNKDVGIKDKKVNKALMFDLVLMVK